MTQEEIKAAVLAECERLWQQRKSAAPNTLWHPEINPKNFIDGLYPLSVTPEDDAWIIAPQYGHSAAFTAISLREVQDCNHIVWMLAYRLLGLNKPPADTKWERLKAEIVSRNEAEVEAIKSLPPIGLPQSVRDAAYATGHVLGWIQGTMTRIEQEESK